MRRALGVVIMVGLVSAMLVGAAAAKPTDKAVGTHVVLGWGPTSLAAGEPFFIAHGWTIDPPREHPVGAFTFRLEMNGIDQGRGQHLNAGVGYADPFFGQFDGSLWRVFLYNFEDGLTAGDYTFTGHWFAPCRAATEQGYPGPCPKPNAPVEVLTRSLTITVTG